MAYTRGSSNNIIVGAAALFTFEDGPIGATVAGITNTQALVDLPDYVNNVSYKTTLSNDANYRNVGYTNNGLQITYNPTYDSVTVDQLLDTAKLFKSAMEVMIATEMAEGTLENVLVVFGQGQSTLTNSGKTLGLEAGALGVAPTERQLIAIGQAPTETSATTERIYYARRVLSVQQTQFSLARNTPTSFPVTFRLLPDAGYTGSEYGKIIDRTWTVA